MMNPFLFCLAPCLLFILLFRRELFLRPELPATILLTGIVFGILRNLPFYPFSLLAI